MIADSGAFYRLAEADMANTIQAKKRARQAQATRVENGAARSAMRTSIKKVLKAVQDKDAANATAAYRQAVSTIDRIAGRGVIHKNTAARYKSRLNTRVRALATA